MSRLWCSWKLPAHACKILLACCCLIEVKRVKKAATNPFGSEGFSCIPERKQSDACPPAAGEASIRTMKVHLHKREHTLETDRLNANSRDPEKLFTNVSVRKNKQGAQIGYILICSTNKIGMLFCLHWISAMLSSWFRGIDSQPLCCIAI